VHTLVPNATALKRGLTTLTRACGAVEAVLFEKTTFLLIAHSEGIRSTTDDNLLSASSSTSTSTDSGTSTGTDTSPSTPGEFGGPILGSTAEKIRQQQLSQLSGNRFERVSSLLKTFKLSSTSWSNEKWIGLHMQLPEFTAVIEPLTVNSYVMVLCADDRIRAYYIWLTGFCTEYCFNSAGGDQGQHPHGQAKV
jgi:Ras-related GTP-binding protein A/B